MFDFKSWLKTGLIDGYKQGSFSIPHVTTMTANYIMAGMLTQEDAAEIDAACTAWSEEQARLEAEKEQTEEIDPGFNQPMDPESKPADDTTETTPTDKA